jgi:hypothetical protein
MNQIKFGRRSSPWITLGGSEATDNLSRVRCTGQQQTDPNCAGACASSRWSISPRCFAAWASSKRMPLQCRQVGKRRHLITVTSFGMRGITISRRLNSYAMLAFGANYSTIVETELNQTVFHFTAFAVVGRAKRMLAACVALATLTQDVAARDPRSRLRIVAARPPRTTGCARGCGGFRMRRRTADFGRGLVFAQTLINDLPQQIVVGPVRYLTIGDQLEPHPLDAAQN